MEFENSLAPAVVIFGGSFNPFHSMHLQIALSVLVQVNASKVLLITCARPVHRDDLLLDAELRHEMVAAAVAGYPQLEACRIEIDREGDSNSVDTVKQIRQLYGAEAQLYFVIGTDHVEGIKNWPGAETIFEECTLLLSPRGSTWSDQLDAWRSQLPEHVRFEPIKLDSTNPFSSGMVRDSIRDGVDVQHLVPLDVYNLLLERGYYKPVSQPESQNDARLAASHTLEE